METSTAAYYGKYSTSATPTPQYYVLGIHSYTIYIYVIGNAIIERILEQLYTIITDIKQEAREINFRLLCGFGRTLGYVLQTKFKYSRSHAVC